jgi:hypothetical protein
LAELNAGEGLMSPLSVDANVVADPTYAAARGMTLYARGRQEVPGHCRERRECIERRDKERNGGNEGKIEL